MPRTLPQLGRAVALSAAVASTIWATGPAALAADVERPVDSRWSLTLKGGVADYVLYSSHPFFGSPDRLWMETSARFGGVLQYEHVAFGLSGIGVKTTGRDPYGTGTRPAGDPASGPRSKAPAFDVDEAYVQIAAVAGLPATLTVGRQYIAIGSQFLIGDGVYDGFSADAQQGVYHNPRKGFDAARVAWEAARFHFDSFAYRVDPTWDAAGGHDGVLGGVDVSRTFEALGASDALGLYYRSSRSNKDNDVWIGNLRVEQRVPRLEGPYVSGEIVGEFAGRCGNALYCTTPGQDMNEYAWHAEVGYRAVQRAWKPFIELGYVYYSTDFTPIATGFSDWGKWYLGNTIDWIVFGTNTKVARAEVGLWPTSALKVRAQYFNTQEVTPSGRSTGGTLSDEVNLIAEWYPVDWLWVTLLVGYAKPGGALARSGLANPFAAINSGATPVGTTDTVHTALAVGVDFTRTILGGR